MFHEDSQYTGEWKYCGVYEIHVLRCLSWNRLYTNMLRIHLFSIFIIMTETCTLTFYVFNKFFFDKRVWSVSCKQNWDQKQVYIVSPSINRRRVERTRWWSVFLLLILLCWSIVTHCCRLYNVMQGCFMFVWF